MAYTAVKWADVNKAITAVKTAQTNYDNAVKNTGSSSTLKKNVDDALKKLNDAQKKLESLQKDYDNQTYAKNAPVVTAKTNLETARKELAKLQSDFDQEKYVTPAIKNLAIARDKAYDFMVKETWRNSGDVKKFYDIMTNPNTTPANAKKAETDWGNAVNKASKAASDDYNNKVKAYDTAYNNANKAAQKIINDKIIAIEGEKNANSLQRKYDIAYETARKTAETAINNQSKLINGENNKTSLQNVYDGHVTKYQTELDKVQPFLDTRNDAINSVKDYVSNIQNSLGDVTKLADAKEVQTLLKNISTTVTNTKIGDLEKAINPIVSKIDPIKMSAIPTVNIAGANPDAFSNIDPNTKLPILDQGALDAVLDRYKSNKINEQQYRDNWNKFGWNVKSDASTAVRGPALVGLDMGSIQQGMSSAGMGIVKAGTNQAATDADFKKAAEQLNIKYDDYVKPVKFVPSQGAYGSTERATAQNSKEYTDPVTGETYLARLSGGKFQTALDKEGLYNTISDRTKDFYLVANSIDGNKHASILFKADGSGNLVPVTNAKNQPFVNYYSATRNVTGQTWYADLVPIAAIAASFAIPGIGQAISQSAFGASLAATVGSQVAANAIINASLSAALSAAVGGDPVKAALTAGIGTAVSANIGEMAKAVGVDDKAISSITSTVNNFGGKVTDADVKNIIANAVSTAVVTGTTDSDKLLENVLTNVAGNFADANVKNYVSSSLAGSIDRQKLASAADAAGNVANVATNAVISGVNIQTALTNAAPSILASASTAYDSALKGKVALNESELSPEAKKIYDNYIASGIDQSSALVAASAADPKFKTAEYGKQFGPALAELDLSKLPQVFQNIPKDTNLRYVGKDADGRDQYVITDKEGGQGLYTIQPDGTATISTTVPSEIAARAKDTLTLDEASTANVLPPTLKKETGFFDDLGSLISTGTSSSFGQSRSLIGKLADQFEVKLDPTGSTIINKATGKEITQEQYDDLLKAGKITNGFKFIANDVFMEFGDTSKNIDEKVVWYDLQPPEVKQKINQKIAEKVDNYTKQVEQEWKQTPPEQKFNVTPIDVKETLKDYEQFTAGGGGAQLSADTLKEAFKPFESQTFESIQQALKASQPQAETSLSRAISSASLATDAPNADIVLKQYAKDPNVSKYYTDLARNNFNLIGVSPTEARVNQSAAELYAKDVKELLASSQPSQPGAAQPGAASAGQAGGTGQAGTSGGTGTGVGTGTGTGTGTGSGAGAGTGSGAGTGTGGGVTTVNQPSGIASLFGALAPSAQPQTQGGQLPLASVFYYGKEFGSPRQEVGPGGQLLQEMYRPLSVSQPGPELAASGEKGENAISALLQSILAEKGDEEDILNILRG